MVESQRDDHQLAVCKLFMETGPVPDNPEHAKQFALDDFKFYIIGQSSLFRDFPINAANHFTEVTFWYFL